MAITFDSGTQLQKIHFRKPLIVTLRLMYNLFLGGPNFPIVFSDEGGGGGRADSAH